METDYGSLLMYYGPVASFKGKRFWKVQIFLDVLFSEQRFPRLGFEISRIFAMFYFKLILIGPDNELLPRIILVIETLQ